MQLSIGSFYPNLLLSGILWPLEGMPSALQYIAKFLPNTLACQVNWDNSWLLLSSYTIWILSGHAGHHAQGLGYRKTRGCIIRFEIQRMLLVEILFLITPFDGILQVYFGLISTSIWIGIFLCLSWIVVKIKSWWPLNDVLSFVLTLKLSYSQCSCMYIAFFHQTVSDT